MSFSSGWKTIRGTWWSIEHPEISYSLWKTDSLSFAEILQERIMMRRQNRGNGKFLAEAQQQQLSTAARRASLDASPIDFGFCQTPSAGMCHCRAPAPPLGSPVWCPSGLSPHVSLLWKTGMQTGDYKDRADHAQALLSQLGNKLSGHGPSYWN